MRSGALAVMVLAAIELAPVPALAQTQQTVSGYVFGGQTSSSGDRPLAWTIGGGGEMITGWKGTTAGLELDGLWIPPLQRDARFGRSISSRVFSANLSHHFRNSPARVSWQPYLTGGLLAITSRNDGVPGFTVGGGVDRWFSSHAGLRIDVRDQFSPGVVHLIGIRAGIVFR